MNRHPLDCALRWVAITVLTVSISTGSWTSWFAEGMESAPQAESKTDRPSRADCESWMTFQTFTLDRHGRQPDEKSLDQLRRLFGEWQIHRALLDEPVSGEEKNSPVDEAAWKQVERQVLSSAFLQELTQGLRVTDSQVERFYREHPDRYRRGESIASRFILRKLDPQAPPEKREEARRLLENLRKRLLAGEDFGPMARQYSEAENANRGGAVSTSSRGRLLEEYEAVAWNLEPGELSSVVQLPDGLALIRLDQRHPARSRSLEEAREGIRKRLRQLQVESMIEEQLALARLRWPLETDLDQGRIVFRGEIFSLETLGLSHRPPRLADQILQSFRSRWLESLARDRGLHLQPEILRRLAFLKEKTRAAREMDLRIQNRRDPVPLEQLTALYAKRKASLRDPEKRTFKVVQVPGEEGAMRRAWAEANQITEAWRAGPIPMTIERWGPITQRQLGSATSPRLARAAFELEESEVSVPLVFEDYDTDRIRYLPEGYVVLRLESIQPKRLRSFREAETRLRREEELKIEKRWRAQIRRELLSKSDLSFDDWVACKGEDAV